MDKQIVISSSNGVINAIFTNFGNCKVKQIDWNDDEKQPEEHISEVDGSYDDADIIEDFVMCENCGELLSIEDEAYTNEETGNSLCDNCSEYNEETGNYRLKRES